MREIDLDQEPTPHELVPVTQSYVAESEQVVLSPLDVAPAVFKAGLERRRENHKALIEWVRAALVEDVDFGKIHVEPKSRCALGKACPNPAHYSKPVLFKPGSEKICGMLAVTPKYPTMKDYEQAAVSGVAIETIILRCELHDQYGNVVAQGVGGRSVSKDYGDVNKALKMAEKSGQIDATLRLAGLSEVFTQDLEDMVVEAEIVASAAPEKPSGVCTDCGSPGAHLPDCPRMPGPAILKPAVQEMLDKAKANREREQTELDKRGPVDRQALRDAGFQVAGCECGAEIGTYTHGTKHYKFEQCSAVKERKVPFSKEHHYKRLG